MDFISKFFHSFNSGEPGFLFMWILLGVGVFGVAIVIERLLFLTSRCGTRVDRFMERVINHVKQDEMEAAKKECEKVGRMSLAQVVKAGLDDANRGSDAIRNSVDEATLKVIPELESRTNYLATIGNIATLLGLMGTIYGLIISFAAVGKPGIDAAEKSTLLASGIAAAMNTTFSGLMVAIPAIVMFALFKAKTQKIIDQIDRHSVRLVNMLVERSYKTRKFHIAPDKIKEGIGVHVTHDNIKVFSDNQLIKEINL